MFVDLSIDCGRQQPCVTEKPGSRRLALRFRHTAYHIKCKTNERERNEGRQQN